MSATPLDDSQPKVSPLNDPKVRGLIFQALLLAVVAFLLYEAVSNAATNLQRQKIASGFGFWNVVSGFDVNQTLIPYSATSTYGRAFWVGLLNTLLVAGIGIVLATLLGFFMGVMRLSSNWIVAKLAMVYVEVVRNVPLLLQLLFWYNAVLKPLPNPRDSIALPALQLGAPGFVVSLISLAALVAGYLALTRGPQASRSPYAPLVAQAVGAVLIVGAIVYWLFWSGIIRFEGQMGVFLNNRGLILPNPQYGEGSQWIGYALIAGVALAALFRFYAHRRQAQTGKQAPVLLVSLALIVGLPLIAFLATGRPITLNYPALRGFNYAGGMQVFPEFFALLLGLVIYTAAFIAEIVRAGIMAVPRGQSEASNALGLRPGPTMKLVVIPQAMRVIIPPLTSQYLNLTKNSSLAVFIGYPDLVQIFTGTVLNQTGQAVEVVAITMLVYLTISLTTSTLMNWYNSRKALVER